MKIGMIFPDYGSQFVGMGKELYDSSRLVQEYFEEAFNCLNINFVKLCFASSDAELAKIENAYVSIFLISVATAELLKQENIIPEIVAGFGIGELSATCIAQGLSLPDGLYFLNKYAQFYQEALQNISVQMMRIEGLSANVLERLCTEVTTTASQAAIAVYESEKQQVASGNADAMQKLKELVTAQKGIFHNLPVGHGLHSSLMDSVVNQLAKYLEKIDFKNLAMPLIAGVDGAVVTKKELIKRRIIKQLDSPLYVNKVLQKACDWDLIIEIGPGTTLAKLIKQKCSDKTLISVNKLSDIEELKAFIAQGKK